MSTNATTGDSTDCPAAAPDFDFSDYLDVCRVCIAGNADVSGLGVSLRFSSRTLSSLLYLYTFVVSALL
jgi:hypothetical protein